MICLSYVSTYQLTFCLYIKSEWYTFTSESVIKLFSLFVLLFNVPVNNYGHVTVKMVS